MKQLLVKKLAMGALVLCAVPGTLLAQTEKEKEKTKDQSERQQIVITRNGDKAEKMVIEIEGDKVKVNGKDVSDAKDVKVQVNNWKTSNAMALRTPAQGRYMVLDDNNSRLFKLDSNRAMLGVVTEGDEDDKGALIQSITKESAADKAGLKKGDIITKVDNRKIEGPGDVTDAIHSHKPGDKVTITYLRDGKEQKATAELSRWKGIDVKGLTAPRVLSENLWRDNENFKTFERNFPNIQMNGLTMANRGKLGLGVQDTDDGKGVKVINVDDEGAAGKAGIREDDIITHIDDKAITGADEVARLMKEKKDQPAVRFQVNRGGKTQNIEVKIPRKLKTVDL